MSSILIISSNVNFSQRLLRLRHHRTQPLHERRVAVMVRRIQPIRTHGPQILQLDLAEPRLQVLTHAQTHAERVCSELAVAGVHGHQKRQEFVHGRPERLEEEEQRDHGGDAGAIESKGLVKRRGIVTERETIEGDARVHLGDDKVGHGVPQLPVPKFVSEDGEDLPLFDLGEEGVVEHNTFVPAKAVHVGVGVGATFGTVHYKEFLEGVV
mmetsp:Transcript_4293/g.8943  ORF Transcript_4293/g.8943 Transcript_4293/m.8943 type:complete len:211 (-) Transcript_4293:897-1529(-)